MIIFPPEIQISCTINKYNQKKAIADEELKKAVPVMEKAHQIMPKDEATMQTLKTLYYRLKMDDKLKQIKIELGDSK